MLRARLHAAIGSACHVQGDEPAHHRALVTELHEEPAEAIEWFIGYFETRAKALQAIKPQRAREAA